MDEAQGMTIEQARGWIKQYPSRVKALEAFLSAYIRARAADFVEAKGQGREAKIVGLDAVAMELHKGRKS
jgi:hypothetical protein